MAVGKDKTGVLINMDKELKSKLEQLAKKDGRSLTNLINKIHVLYLYFLRFFHLRLGEILTLSISSHHMSAIRNRRAASLLTIFTQSRDTFINCASSTHYKPFLTQNRFCSVNTSISE